MVLCFGGLYQNVNQMADFTTAEKLEEAIVIADNMELTIPNDDESIIYGLKIVYGNIPSTRYKNGFFQYNKVTKHVTVKYNKKLNENCVKLE
jgi:hypothetical protein